MTEQAAIQLDPDAGGVKKLAAGVYHRVKRHLHVTGTPPCAVLHHPAPARGELRGVGFPEGLDPLGGEVRRGYPRCGTEAPDPDGLHPDTGGAAGLHGYPHDTHRKDCLIQGGAARDRHAPVVTEDLGLHPGKVKHQPPPRSARRHRSRKGRNGHQKQKEHGHLCPRPG